MEMAVAVMAFFFVFVFKGGRGGFHSPVLLSRGIYLNVLVFGCFLWVI